MVEIGSHATLWLGLVLIATLVSIYLMIVPVLPMISIGTTVPLITSGVAGGALALCGGDENGKVCWLAGMTLSMTSVVGVCAPKITDSISLVVTLALNAGAFFLAWLTPRFSIRFDERISGLKAKLVKLCLIVISGFTTWASGEIFFSTFLNKIILAGTIGEIHVLIWEFRTVSLGLRASSYYRFVVKHPSYSTFDHWLLGSAARQMINHAICPVTVIREVIIK
jgi:hypothetical protein